MALLNMQGPDLAWALIEAAKPHLNTLERNYVFVTVGAGDTFAGVHQLLKLIAAKRIPLQPHLMTLCKAWLGPYAEHEEYDYLRRLIEDFLIPDTMRASAAITRSPSAPEPVPLLTVTSRRAMRRLPAEPPQRRYVKAMSSTCRSSTATTAAIKPAMAVQSRE